MKKGSGGRITSLTLEKKGGWEGGREREGWLGDASGNAAAPGSAPPRFLPSFLCHSARAAAAAAAAAATRINNNSWEARACKPEKDFKNIRDCCS